MGFGNDDVRASHTIRIFGTNKAGDVLHDIWLDLERIDVYRISAQRDGHFQGIYRRLYWLDDPAAADYKEAGNPARVEGTKKICSPDEEDQEDPAEWIPVRTIIEMDWNKSIDTYRRKGSRRGNRTSADNKARAIEARRCFHRDTIIDEDVEAATTKDPTLKAYVVSSDKYNFVENTEDKDAYIEVEYVSYTEYHSSRKEDEGKNQLVQFNLKNKHYLKITDKAKGPANPVHGFDPPWALDPFQAIINCQFATGEQAVLGLKTEVTPPASPAYSTRLSKDGKDWTAGFGNNTSSAASGLGHTVIGGRNVIVVFGKPRDGDPCFIAVGGTTAIRRGVLNNEGNLEFTTIGTLPVTISDSTSHGINALSFAGGAFFIGYNKTDDFNMKTWLAVSFDGKTFSYGINAFSGVDTTAIYNPDGIGSPIPAPKCGSVSYDSKKEVYVAAGHYDRTYPAYYVNTGTTPFENVNYRASDTNLMTSRSIDGITWTPHFDESQGFGNGSSLAGATDIGCNGHASSVTFGKGVHVAATTYKVRSTRLNGTDVLVEYQPACAVAVSTDGVKWSNGRLPGSIAYYDSDNLVAGGFGMAVKFFKTSGTTPDGYPKGFFVAAGREFVPHFVSPDLTYSIETKMWFSEDGRSWSLVGSQAEQTGWILTAINKNVKPGSPNLFYL